MAFSHGKLAVIQVDNAAGTLTSLTEYSDEIGFPMETEASETTVFGNGNKQYIPGLGDATVSISGKFDPAVNTLVAAVWAGQLDGSILSSSVEFGPAGSTSGLPKYTAEAVLTSYEPSSSVGDPNTFSIEYQVTGGVVIDTFA